ncbi:hypothetical protein PHLGIDRAFT_270704 [Phlebiopsis gigantea 11061_1 CR5-6]|uniref:Uncharacterized protein n=1 Tax=Phlebiopsis gigantea (strain 11061_1 CR5-6) TaxID=745531 RepID=A0A0C3PCR7_PHLG1|nr:hypothetical protein PHLGIDRAFT_270704 [Phlebiopsis gigantea 11061_1 CR5-6]
MALREADLSSVDTGILLPACTLTSLLSCAATAAFLSNDLDAKLREARLILDIIKTQIVELRVLDADCSIQGVAEHKTADLTSLRELAEEYEIEYWEHRFNVNQQCTIYWRIWRIWGSRLANDVNMFLKSIKEFESDFCTTSKMIRRAALEATKRSQI